MVIAPQRKVNNERWLLWFVVLPSVVYYLNYILKVFGITGWPSRVFYPLTMVCGAYILVKALLRRPAEQVACLIVTAVIVAYSLLMGNDAYLFDGTFSGVKSYILSDWNVMLSLCLPVIYLAVLGVDYERMFGAMRRCCLVVVGLQLAVFVLTQIRGDYTTESDYMSYSYGAMISLFVCQYEAKHHWLYRVAAVISAALILIAGARGALLTMILFFAVLWVLRVDFTRARSVIAMAAAAVVLLLMLLNGEQILTFLIQRLARIGFSSRTLLKLSEGLQYFFASDGRNTIYEELFQAMRPWGTGLFSDRLVVGTYAHNWVLETLYAFGYVPGTVLCLAVVALSAKAALLARRNGGREYVYLAALALALVYGKFMFSASYLTNPEFFLAVTVLLYIPRRLAAVQGEVQCQEPWGEERANERV